MQASEEYPSIGYPHSESGIITTVRQSEGAIRKKLKQKRARLQAIIRQLDKLAISSFS
jgi:hypothetical protein